jgi:hypothetical protein
MHSASSTGWDEANQRLCSVLAHPFGLPLVTMFDCLVNCDNNDDIQALTLDSSPVLKKLENLVYLDGDHLNLLQAIKDASSARDEIVVALRDEIRPWYAATENETILTKGISDRLNKVWTVRNSVVSDCETPAENSKISGRCDVVLYDEQASIVANPPKRLRHSERLLKKPPSPPRITPEIVKQIRKSNQAVALMDFGNENDIWWKKFHQCAQYVDQKLEGKSMNEPMLVAVVTYDFKDSEETFKFKIAVFLCWNFNGRVRMCLLWRKCEEGLDTFIRRLSTIAAIALRLQKWRTDAYPEELYKVLGPNCSRVASKVCLRSSILSGLAVRLAVTV